MNEVNLTEEVKKGLKLFSYYCMSMGADEVRKGYSIEECGLNNWDDNWEKGRGNTIESYPEINELISNLLTEYEDNILNLMEDCGDNYGEAIIEIDCKERYIVINVTERVHSTRDTGDELTSDEVTEKLEKGDALEEYQKIIKKMQKNNINEGYIEFNGGGDSGEIYEYIELGGKVESIKIKDKMLNFLYDWLESHYGGWEINEGSQGKFVLYQDGTMQLDFQENIEEYEDRGKALYSKF